MDLLRAEAEPLDGHQGTGSPVPTLPLPGCVALGKSLPSLGPRRDGTASGLANSGVFRG